ncbi:MAG TPA: methyl-accepting chemotaxis protein [Candidatus Limnocylindrales bacterium]|nr:methyl-accepting chemotaxis protein [Candidatus Limnocylindrales bacterium]
MKLRIAGQLASGYAVTILALALVVSGACFAFAHMTSLKGDMLAKTVFRSKARDILLQITASRYATRGYTLTLKKSNLKQQHTAIEKARTDLAFLTGHVNLVPEAKAGVEQAGGLIARIDERSRGVSRLVDRDRTIVLETYRGAKGPKYAEAHAEIDGNVADNGRLEKVLADILILANTAAEASSAAFDTQVALIERLMLLVGIAAVAGAIAVTVIQSRRMSRRLNRVSAALEAVVSDDFARLSQALVRMAEGDLRASFTSSRRPIGDRAPDEIGDLVRSYDALAEGLTAVGADVTNGFASLREVIGGVAGASRSLSLASEQTSSAANQASVAVEQIAKAVDSVAGGAKEQAAKLAQASAAVEELARSAEAIADGATHQAAAIQQATSGMQLLDDGIASLSNHGTALAHTARDASGEAGGGNEAVGETRATMQRLRGASQSAAQAMSVLEERSQQVQEIVRTIEEIADQTNLLALNAAIEAARAGDHGRGFAVVADEVRKLAERSSSATGEISSILTAIRRETVTAADAMRASDTSVAGGLTVAERAAAALNGVERAIETTTGVAEELAERARKMRDASLRVTENVGSASAGVEENAAAASQMRITTQEVTTAIVPVAAAAEEQSAAAQQAAIATGELASGVQEIDATARALREEAERLDALVARFIVGDASDGALRVPSFAKHVAIAS